MAENRFGRIFFFRFHIVGFLVVLLTRVGSFVHSPAKKCYSLFQQINKWRTFTFAVDGQDFFGVCLSRMAVVVILLPFLAVISSTGFSPAHCALPTNQALRFCCWKIRICLQHMPTVSLHLDGKCLRGNQNKGVIHTLTFPCVCKTWCVGLCKVHQ